MSDNSTSDERERLAEWCDKRAARRLGNNEAAFLPGAAKDGQRFQRIAAILRATSEPDPVASPFHPRINPANPCAVDIRSDVSGWIHDFTCASEHDAQLALHFLQEIIKYYGHMQPDPVAEVVRRVVNDYNGCIEVLRYGDEVRVAIMHAGIVESWWHGPTLADAAKAALEDKTWQS